jgi:homoserine kinase
VLVPRHLRTTTASARGALADRVARRDAVFNVGHASLLALALTQDPGLLEVALRDRLHEDARLEAVPEARDLLHALRERQIPACVSGAGPSLLAFPPGGRDIGAVPDGWRPIRVNVRGEGVDVDVEA